MKILNPKYLLIILFVMLATGHSEAQLHLNTYMDGGMNNASEGFYLKSSVLGGFQFGGTRVEAGSRQNLVSTGSVFFSGLSATVSEELTIRLFDFELQGLFMYIPFSELVHESDFGILVNIERDHFRYKLGTSFRTYRITQEAVEDYDIVSDRSLHENMNMLYLLGYNVKPAESDWNIGITLSNIDHFLISQETNPMLFLRAVYKLSLPLTVYAESWYKGAGSLNISANHFGFFFRTGIIWQSD